MVIVKATEAGSSTVRWVVGDTSTLLGFLSPQTHGLIANKFRAAHPALDALDGDGWGKELRERIAEAMKAAP